METHFFNQIAQLAIQGKLHLVITQEANSQLVVSVLLENEQCSDPAKHLLPPLVLRGTAEELDAGFFLVSACEYGAVHRGAKASPKAISYGERKSRETTKEIR